MGGLDLVLNHHGLDHLHIVKVSTLVLILWSLTRRHPAPPPTLRASRWSFSECTAVWCFHVPFGLSLCETPPCSTIYRVGPTVGGHSPGGHTSDHLLSYIVLPLAVHLAGISYATGRRLTPPIDRFSIFVAITLEPLYSFIRQLSVPCAVVSGMAFLAINVTVSTNNYTTLRCASPPSRGNDHLRLIFFDSFWSRGGPDQLLLPLRV